MNTDQIATKVIELAAEQGGVPPTEVTAAHHFVNDLNYDSLDRVEFAMSLEDEFEMSVPDERADQFQTVGDVIRYIQEQSAVQVGQPAQR